MGIFKIPLAALLYVVNEASLIEIEGFIHIVRGGTAAYLLRVVKVPPLVGKARFKVLRSGQNADIRIYSKSNKSRRV